MTYSRTTWANKVNSGDPITISDHDVNDDDIVSFINDLESKVVLKTDQIDTANIKNSAITEAKISNNSVTTSKIADANITTDKLNNKAVTTAKIDDKAVTATQIADNTITASQIASKTITASEIADTTITGGKLANNTITATQIANNTITATQLASNAVETAKIKDSAVTTAKINNGAVTDAKTSFTNLTATTVYAANNFKINPSGLSHNWTGSVTFAPASGKSTINIYGNPTPAIPTMSMVNYSSGEIVFVRNTLTKIIAVYSNNGTLQGYIPQDGCVVLICLSNSLIFIAGGATQLE